MTKIYTYCLFDKFDHFLGVYSSLKAVHRDATAICNQGTSSVYMIIDNKAHACSLTALRNAFRGKQDYQIKYQRNVQFIKIFKTKLRE